MKISYTACIVIGLVLGTSATTPSTRSAEWKAQKKLEPRTNVTGPSTMLPTKWIPCHRWESSEAGHEDSCSRTSRRVWHLAWSSEVLSTYRSLFSLLPPGPSHGLSDRTFLESDVLAPCSSWLRGEAPKSGDYPDGVLFGPPFARSCEAHYQVSEFPCR